MTAQKFPLRPPEQVMRLERMGASYPTRLSFLRVLLRALAADNARVSRPVWMMDRDGYGHAVYSVDLGGHTYSLVAVSNHLADDRRTDRVIATAWDAAFVLYDGIPSPAEIARICAAAPKQEAGRFTDRDLILSRANKSVRLFAHVTEALRAGHQPDADKIRDVGYLMRTTAVYGNGKFGISDRARIANRPCLNGPFMAEMLTVWLIRGFTFDLAEHVGGASLARGLKRHLGVGNATGLGMAPFLVSHPRLLNAWTVTRETALALVRNIEFPDVAQIETLYRLAERVAAHLAEWRVPDPDAQAIINQLRRDWPAFTAALTPDMMTAPYPIDAMLRASGQYSIDLQELVVALVLEPFGDLIDGLTSDLSAPDMAPLDPMMPLDSLRTLLQRDWVWALAPDYDAPVNCARFWYVSEEKMEPRLGDRFADDGADLESPLDIARQAKALATDLDGKTGLAGDFLCQHPQHRSVLRRIQTLANHPYSEIRDNLIGAACRPIDMLRCKLAFFGASRFDPKSDLWTRINLAQGAPLFDELETADDWWLSHSGMV